ncbi:type II toxin-antitoxin system RelE/ParE family toxin [Gordonia alkanivorans]|uniref:type II toxin-antitoxin system RelE/ParE family toxin n=1 Tax=Gordonia alkanivorans TaxID=84096 RepID=UPI0005AAC70A|nr:type II toxin-antitoxin system RelE/ParE family toxin [Gordonia alkanivorans]
MKKVVFEGDSKEMLRSFPTRARRTLGYALDAAQRGEIVATASPVRPVGPGCWELRATADGGWYRLIYVVAGETLHVLVAFQKKSNKIDGSTMDLARKRLKAVTT